MTTPAPLPSDRKFGSETSRRDLILGAAGAVIALAFILWGISALFSRMESRGANGVIIGKEIIPRSETEFTIGAGGLRKKEIEGRYVLRVRVPAEDRVYLVYVTESVFNSAKIGDPYFLVKPPVPEPQKTAPSPAPDTPPSPAEPAPRSTPAP